MCSAYSPLKPSFFWNFPTRITEIFLFIPTQISFTTDTDKKNPQTLFYSLLLPKEVGVSLGLVVLLQCEDTFALYETGDDAMRDIW